MASPCQAFHPPGLYLRSVAVTSINDTGVAVVAVRALDAGSDGARGLWGPLPHGHLCPRLPPARPGPAGPAGGALLPPASATAHPHGRRGRREELEKRSAARPRGKELLNRPKTRGKSRLRAPGMRIRQHRAGGERWGRAMEGEEDMKIPG